MPKGTVTKQTMTRPQANACAMAIDVLVGSTLPKYDKAEREKAARTIGLMIRHGGWYSKGKPPIE